MSMATTRPLPSTARTRSAHLCPAAGRSAPSTTRRPGFGTRLASISASLNAARERYPSRLAAAT
jgi:hypothetical protein